MNDTLTKFGFPDSLIKSYEYWSVLLRPDQATLGSVILINHGNAHAFGDLSSEATSELSIVTNDIETALSNCFKYDKINYLMLMMIDPHVHFHVIPRYSTERIFKSVTILDEAWPGPPNLSSKVPMDTSCKQALLEQIKSEWPN